MQESYGSEEIEDTLENPYLEEEKLKDKAKGFKRPHSTPALLTTEREHSLDKEQGKDEQRSLDLSSLKTQISEKTGWMLTSITIAKSYYGVGSLAIPWGFHLCGFQLALAMIMINSVFSFFTCYTLIEA